MTQHAFLPHVPQVSSTIESLNKSKGLSFREVFSGGQIGEVIGKTVSNFRGRVFSPDVTLFAFMHQALSEDKSLREAISRVNADRIAAGEEPASLNTASFSTARIELPTALPRELFYTVGKQLENIAQQELAGQGSYKGRSVKVADGSTLLMADTKENQDKFPQMKSQKKGSGFPIARIVVIFSLFTAAALDLAIGPYRGKETGEHALLRQLFHCFDRGDIVLGDAYYASYFLMAMLIEMGVDFVFQSHGARKSDFRNGMRLGKGDHIITFKKPKQPDWMNDDLYALMPSELRVREIRVTIERAGLRSKHLCICTSMLDSKAETKAALGCLYACRWAAELNLRDLKSTMKMDMLRCKTPDMIKKEIWVHLLAYNVIRKIMLEAAVRRGVLPWQISFKASIQTLNNYSTLWRHKNLDRDNIYTLMLDAVASQIVGNRPGRSEPRKRKRRAKPATLLQGKRNSSHVDMKPTREQLEIFQNDVIELKAQQRKRA